MGCYSIAICTRNRADRLEDVLASLHSAKPPTSFEWEILVVLNDCTDTSAEVVRNFIGQLPITATVEKQQGLSHARNRAAKICRGEFIVFIDDDVRVDPSFLVAYETAFRTFPEADVFSGPITPVFEGCPPNWLERTLPAFGSAFAQQQVAHDGATIDPAVPPYGGNYAIRRSVQREWPYDPTLGRGDVDWLRGGEETELLKAVFASGSSGRWVAAASVEHMIGPARQTLAYLWRYYEGYGMLVGNMERTRPQRSSSRLSAARKMMTTELVYRVKRLLASPERWSVAMVRAAVRRGEWKSRRLN